MTPSLPPRPFLYAIVDAEVSGDAFVPDLARALVGAGVRLLQLRAKALTDRRFCELARTLVGIAHESGAMLLVNDRPDVAVVTGADGVHLGQDDLSPAEARATLAAGSLVGLSTHGLDDLARSEGYPIDYVAIGPVFATVTKRNPDPVVGLRMVADARVLTARPLVAIGGIRRDNAGAVVAAGADGVAVISDLVRDGDVAAAVAGFRRAMAEGR